MAKAGLELQDRLRLRTSGDVPVRFLGNVRDLSERSDLSVRGTSAKIADENGFPDQGENFQISRIQGFPDCRFKFPARRQKIPCSRLQGIGP